MNLILGYLEWDWSTWELLNCSLVNSYWLYQAWNVQPTKNHSVNLETISNQTLKICDYYTSKGKNSATSVTSAWQRLVYAKSIIIKFSDFELRFYLDERTSEPGWDTLLNRLAMLKRITDINFSFPGEYISALKVLMHNCRNQIESVNGEMNDLHEYDEVSPRLFPLSPLDLPNAIVMEIQYGNRLNFFYYRWTNKCKVLTLGVDAGRASAMLCEDWIEFVVNNCDCSNIKTLCLKKDVYIDNSVPLHLLKKFAAKFSNLKELQLDGCGSELIDTTIGLFAFWVNLANLVNKNKNQMRVSFSTDICNGTNWKRLCSVIDENNGQVNELKLEIGWNRLEEQRQIDEKSIKRVLLNGELESVRLSHNIQFGTMENEEVCILQQFCQCLKDKRLLSTTYSALGMIEIGANISGENLQLLIEYLSLDVIRVHRLFIMIKFVVIISIIHKLVIDHDELNKEFDQLCEMIHELLMNEMIPMDILIEFPQRVSSLYHDIDLSTQLCNTFQRHFDEMKLSQQYVAPRCNQHCEALEKAKVNVFYQSDHNLKRIFFAVKNARQVKYCRKS